MKKILSVILVLVSLTALFSCNNGGSGDGEGAGAGSQQQVYAYTVKVMAGTTPIVGAKIDLRNESVDKKEILETDDKGEAALVFDTEIAGDWVAKIISIPDAYGINRAEYLGKTYSLVNGTVTITFAQVAVPQFEVKVVDQNGTAVAGAMVQICLDSCYMATTDENGIARLDYKPGDYKANILELPAGYTDITSGEKFAFEDLKCEIVVAKN